MSNSTQRRLSSHRDQSGTVSRVASPALTRLRNGGIALALGLLFCIPAAQPVWASANTLAGGDVPIFSERHRFHPELTAGTTGGWLGEASDLAGATAVYTVENTRAFDPGPGPHRQAVRVAVAADESDEHWVEHELVPPDSDLATRMFGAAVTVSPDEQTVFVSSPYEARVYAYPRGAAGDWSGAPRVYDAPLPPPRVGYQESQKNSYLRSFGESMATDGTSLVVGVPNANVDGQTSVGMVWQLNLETGTWRSLLPAPEARLTNTILGQSVAVSGDLIAAGLPQGRSTDGSYLRVGGVALWSGGSDFPHIIAQPSPTAHECIPDDDGQGPAFGLSVAFSGRTLFVGSPFEVRFDAGAACKWSDVEAKRASQGAIYRFDETLTQIGPKLVAPHGNVSFGRTIDVDGDTLMAFVETTEANTTGSVFVYSLHDLSSDESSGSELLAPQQSLLPAGYTGTDFGAFDFGTGISISGKRALIAGNTNDSYLFSELAKAEPQPTLSLANSQHTYGQRGSLVATIEPATSTAVIGPVEFSAGTNALGSSALVAGAATLQLPPSAIPATPGTPITATAPTEQGPLLAVATLRVDPSPTTITDLTATPLMDGTGWRLNGSVTAQYDTIPTGQLELPFAQKASLEAGGFSATIPSSSNNATVKTSATVRYLGDGNHLQSEQSVDLPPLISPPTKPHDGRGDSVLRATGAADGPVTMATVAIVLLAAGGAAYAVSRWRLTEPRR